MASGKKIVTMKPQLYLSIPTPCHENWDVMTPNQEGKFCKSCCKTVVDFTTMSDAEVLNFFKRNTANTCGRFNNTQLDRGIVEQTVKQRKSLKWLLASMLSIAIFAKAKSQNELLGENVVVKENRKPPKKPKSIPAVRPAQIVKQKLSASQKTIEASEQKNQALIKGDTIVTLPKKDLNEIINKEVQIVDTPTLKTKTVEVDLVCVVVGGISASRYDYDEQYFYTPPPAVIINGIIVDENNQPVPYASIQIKNKKGTIANNSGTFELKVNRLKNNLVVEISSLGFENKTVILNKKSNANLGAIVLKAKTQELEDVVVFAGNNTIKGRVTMGATTTYRRVTSGDTLSTIKKSIKKLFGFEMFSVYPNPAKAAEILNIKAKEGGDYLVQLLDGQLKLLKTQTSKIDKNQIIPFQLPTMVSGVFYVRLINEKSKKTWVEKIVIIN